MRVSESEAIITKIFDLAGKDAEAKLGVPGLQALRESGRWDSNSVTDALLSAEHLTGGEGEAG